MEKFIETAYYIKYNRNHIIPNFQKNTNGRTYYFYRPMDSDLLQTEFYYDKTKGRFYREGYVNLAPPWDPTCDDTFS